MYWNVSILQQNVLLRATTQKNKVQIEECWTFQAYEKSE